MKRLNVPFVSKKFQKRVAGRCRVCKEPIQEVLDVHRILEGQDGGKYSYDNTCVICTKCHRLQQAGTIQILGWVHSSAGRLLHIVDEYGKEDFR